MVGRERHDDRIVAAAAHEFGAGCNRGRGIAPHRLQHDIGLDLDLGELLDDQETVVGVGDDDRPAKQRGIADPADGVLECRSRAEQRQELLRPILARCRPQACSGAAAHD